MKDHSETFSAVTNPVKWTRLGKFDIIIQNV
jgi:hypothetical protein